MKKWLLVLGMITCIFGVSACGSEQTEEEATIDIDVEKAEIYGEQVVQTLATLCGDSLHAEEKAEYEKNELWAAAISSWESAMPDMGSYVDILETTVEIDSDGTTINIKVDGTDHDAYVEVLADEDGMITNITTVVEYSFAEMMYKAALNTLLGMGTVFVVLILISAIISCFSFIPKIQAAFAKKPKEEEKKDTTVDNTIAQIVEKEELSDDLELVAVIAAAIAASEGATSTDGFVVRSIRKRRY